MGTQNDPVGSSSNQGGPNNAFQKDQNIYEDRPGTKKIIRIITVMAYLFSVSFIAIVLSAYYIFLWQPPNPRLIYRAHIMDGVHADFLIHNPFEEQKDIDRRNKDQIFKENVWNGNSKQLNLNISRLMPFYPNILRAMTFENSSMMDKNENHNDILDKRSNVYNSMNNQFEDLKSNKNIEITNRPSQSKNINATNHIFITSRFKENSEDNNNSQIPSNNAASHQHVVGDNNINIESLQNPPLSYHPITKLLLPVIKDTYGEQSFQKSSSNQTNLLDKLKAICASTHKETSEKSESKNSDDGSTTDPVVTTMKNRILELQEMNKDQKL